MSFSTHYSRAQRAKDLTTWAANAAASLARQFAVVDGTPVLCYSGMSGVALATALEIELYNNHPSFKFDMAYVRKVGERSHGQGVEHNIRGIFRAGEHIGVFVDDMIDSGDTLRHVNGSLKKFFGVTDNVIAYQLLSDYDREIEPVYGHMLGNEI